MKAATVNNITTSENDNSGSTLQHVAAFQDIETEESMDTSIQDEIIPTSSPANTIDTTLNIKATADKQVNVIMQHNIDKIILNKDENNMQP